MKYINKLTTVLIVTLLLATTIGVAQHKMQAKNMLWIKGENWK